MASRIRHVLATADAAATGKVIAVPEALVQQRTVSVAGRQLETLVATPQNPRGTLLYFAGFNTPMGPWDAARCRLLAEVSNCAVATAELPGQSRHGQGFDTQVRQRLWQRDSQPWAQQQLRFLLAGLAEAGRELAAPLHVLGYSTGASLACHAANELATKSQLTSLTLVEPVATGQRSIWALEAANIADLVRYPRVARTNQNVGEWIHHAWWAQLREPGLRLHFVDLLAMATMLASQELCQTLACFLEICDDTVCADKKVAGTDVNNACANATSACANATSAGAETAHTDAGAAHTDAKVAHTDIEAARDDAKDACAGVPQINLIRGMHSSLSQAKAFEKLAINLEIARAPGETIFIDQLGHQLWHSFPTVSAIMMQLFRSV